MSVEIKHPIKEAIFRKRFYDANNVDEIKEGGLKIFKQINELIKSKPKKTQK